MRQVTRFASDLILEGEDIPRVRLVRKVDVPTRITRLVIRATTVFPWWISLILRLFSWAILPWAERDWDDYRRWRFAVLRPTRKLGLWWDRRYQVRAINSLLVQDIHVGNWSTIVEPLPAKTLLHNTSRPRSWATTVFDCARDLDKE